MKPFLLLSSVLVFIQTASCYPFYPNPVGYDLIRRSFQHPVSYDIAGRTFQTAGSSASAGTTNTFANTYANPFNSPFPTLTSITGLRPLSSYLPRIITATEFASLTTLVNNLQTIVNEVVNPRCTPDATTIGAQLVDGQCFSVETVAKSYYDAKLKCFDQGGKLAEPSYNNYNFYRDIQTVFSSKITEIGFTPIYIGISGTAKGNCSCNANNATTTLFTYNSNGFVVPSSNNIWVTPENPGPTFANATAAGNTQAAYIRAPTTLAGPWLLNREDILQTTSRPFICQYDVI